MKKNNKSFEQSIVTKKFIAAFYDLKQKKVIRTRQDFCVKMDYHVSALTEILKGRRNVTIELLRKFFIEYNVEPSLLFNDNKSVPKVNTQNIETIRILAVFNKLKQSDKIKGVDDFCKIINYNASGFSSIKTGKRNAPFSLMMKTIKRFDVSMNYIFEGQEPMFNKE